MSKSLQNQADFFSYAGAQALVEAITAYWCRRGFRGINAERYQHPEFPGSWFVRSNIGPAGYPPRASPKFEALS